MPDPALSPAETLTLTPFWEPWGTALGAVGSPSRSSQSNWQADRASVHSFIDSFMQPGRCTNICWVPGLDQALGIHQ